MRDPVGMEPAYRRLGGIPGIAYPGVDELWPGVCVEVGHRMERSWKAIEKSGYFCTYCVGSRVLPEVAVAAMVGAGCAPLDPYVAYQRPWRCQCLRCKRTIHPRYESILAGQTPCAYCAHRKVDPDEARQVMIDAGAIPSGTFPGPLAQWPSVCARCAEDITQIYNVVLKGHDPCAYCAGNRISVTEAHALAARCDLEPLEDYQAAGQVWQCRCTRCGTNEGERRADGRYSPAGCGLRHRAGRSSGTSST